MAKEEGEDSKTPPVRLLLPAQVGDGDILIPSAEEGPRLARALPRASLRVMKGHSHALLQARARAGGQAGGAGV